MTTAPSQAGPRRIFLAGATGVIGIRLVPLLIQAGHTVAGMTRTAAKADALRSLGAEPIVCDVYDAAALAAAVRAFAPDTIVHQLTDLSAEQQPVAVRGAANARIRREGTRHLLAAAGAAGASRFLVQSVAWTLEGDGGAAKQEMELAVLDFGGVVLRYGRFYGPGTYAPDPDHLPDPPRIHVEEAARRTLPTLDAPSGILTIVEA